MRTGEVRQPRIQTRGGAWQGGREAGVTAAQRPDCPAAFMSKVSELQAGGADTRQLGTAVLQQDLRFFNVATFPNWWYWVQVKMNKAKFLTGSRWPQGQD